MKSQSLKQFGLPTDSGVYFFCLGDEVLYIGKATNLISRVKSYFSKDLMETRGPLIVKMVEDADNIKFEKTDSVLEALILESNLIKKHQPKYNTKEKDNKSYNYVCITRDAFPRVTIERGRLIDFKKKQVRGQIMKSIYGPYTSGESLRTALRIIRKIFPYLDAKTLKKDRYEFYKQLHLAPDIVEDSARKKYLKNIKNIELFFSGNKKNILKSLEKDMLSFAKSKKFEEANLVKKQIFALTHINDVALIKDEIFNKVPPYSGFAKNFRIEAYDIAHLSGSSMVGAYSVVINGAKDIAEYRTFNIRGFTSSNDAGALAELIERRLNHKEWQYPDLIVADGNDVQKNVIEKELKKRGLQISVVSLVKDKSHRARAIIGDVDIINKQKKSIILANAEVHRFVLAKHKIKRSKNFLPKPKK